MCSFATGTNSHFLSVGTYSAGYVDGTDMTTSACKMRAIYTTYGGLQDVEIMTVIWFGDW